MRGSIKAVIFDMDGVLIDSEHLWRKAMIKGFKEYGMDVNENDCRKTMGQRIGEVIRYWLAEFRLTAADPADVENTVMTYLFALIENEGRPIDGIPAIISYCRQKGLKTGLATSSSNQLMKVVLNKLGMADTFDIALSAEHMKYGKPHPEVFLVCAEQLRVSPKQCLVIEDSLNGVIAAKAAQMKVVAVPDDEHTRMKQFALADYKMDKMTEVLPLFKDLF